MLQVGQVWELKSDLDFILVVMLLSSGQNPDGEPYWYTLVLHDTLYPDAVGTVTRWREREILEETHDSEGEFVRLA